ncbi:uncharacterized protein [Nicotiana tomentosiformis]|uniref:uncharacterized protein n=1 Tax=Nicotiana tomentosiformis TaxID=4098 RepID=UPI00388C757B
MSLMKKVKTSQRENANPRANATETEALESAFYRLREVGYTWAARDAEFENLKQENMSVWDYHLKFVNISRYILYMLPTLEARVHVFVQGLSPLVINETATTTLNYDMTYVKMVAFAQATKTWKLKRRMEWDNNNKACSAGNFSGSYSGGGGGKVQSVAVGQCQANPGQHGTLSTCSWYGTTSQLSSHYFHNTSQARGTLALTGSGAAGGGAQGLGGPGIFYAMMGHQRSKAYPYVVTGILTVQSHNVYGLIDLGSTLSYVIPYVSMEFGIETKLLRGSFYVSTPVGESIVAMGFYRDCIITMHGRDTTTNLIELVMVDFDVIMEMDWIYSCFAKLDFRTITVRFEFPDEPVIELKGDDVMLRVGLFLTLRP